REFFGESFDIFGNLAVIGAPGGFTNSTGRAFVFNLQTGTQTRELTLPNLAAGERFGQDVAMDDDFIAVGAPNPYLGNGSVYIFDAHTGSLLYHLVTPNGALGDNFGQSLALEGDTLLVSASNQTRNGVDYAGQIYLFNARSGILLDTFGAPDTTR